nr:MAG TPA: hypothetical protein [Caudoviricetes sp.]
MKNKLRGSYRGTKCKSLVSFFVSGVVVRPVL